MLALWFLGLIDIRWRAAEVSKQPGNWAGALKSDGTSTLEEEEFGVPEREKGRERVGRRDLFGANLTVGESEQETG